MKKIRLGNSTKLALVDDEDWDRVIRYLWRVAARGYVIGGAGKQQTYLHRFILAPLDPARRVEFKNGNKLDCRKKNLLVKETASTGREGKWSRHKGVTYHFQNGTWMAQICEKGRVRYLGTFETEEKAAEAYQQAVEQRQRVV